MFFPVVVSFDPISYTVTEEDDMFAVLTVVRMGGLDRNVRVLFTPADGSAIGMYVLSQTITPEMPFIARWL